MLMIAAVHNSPAMSATAHRTAIERTAAIQPKKIVSPVNKMNPTIDTSEDFSDTTIRKQLPNPIGRGGVGNSRTKSTGSTKFPYSGEHCGDA